VSDPLEDLRDRAPGLRWDTLTYANLTTVAGLVSAIEHVDDTIERHDLAYLHNLWDGCGGNPTAVVGRDRHGNVVAWAWDLMRPGDVNPRSVRLLGGVHPGWRDKDVGSALVRWQLDAARAWDRATRRSYYGPLQITATVDAKLDGARNLFRSHGMTEERYYLDLFRTLDEAEPPTVPELPEGVALRPYLDVDGEAVRAAHNEVWAGLGSHQIGPAEWDASIKRGAGCRALSWAATVGRRVVAYAINSSAPISDGHSAGWTERIGTIPAWRRQGIAAALLQASARTFLEHGYRGAGVGFDTTDPDGGMSLYTTLGYQLMDSMVSHTLTE
jgi:GNAT superfamily N-acetyltransferase